MDNGLIFPCRAVCDKDVRGGTEEDRPAEVLALAPHTRVGGPSRKIREVASLRRAVKAIARIGGRFHAPEKSVADEYAVRPYLNQHKWVRREA